MIKIKVIKLDENKAIFKEFESKTEAAKEQGILKKEEHQKDI